MPSWEQNGEEGKDDDGNGYIDDIYGYNVRSDDGDVTDTDGHGTHVAGIIAMKQTKDSSVEGIYPNAKIMTVKAGNTVNGFSGVNIATAIDYAVENGADVINMSLGTTYLGEELEAALENARKHSVLTASAGNYGDPTHEKGDSDGENMFPACLPYVLGVMSTDSEDMLSTFSNWDRKPETDVE